MLSCEACQKVYSTPYNLKKHWKRQPLCEQWINLQPGLKDFIDHKLGLENKDHTETNTTCMACKTSFANVGNLNRHLATSLICSKWDLYNDLEPIHGYIGKLYSEFDAPKYSLCHIIWNVFLIDKEFAKNPEMIEILKENNAKYVIAILPQDEGSENYDWLQNLGVDHTVMKYKGHNMEIDANEFDVQCNLIEQYRHKRENVFVFCNNGYQRSIPFLTYYLCKHHADEVPSIDQAIDIILPQVDKSNYSHLRDKYVESMQMLFD